jgi:hypothetical protein
MGLVPIMGFAAAEWTSSVPVTVVLENKNMATNTSANAAVFTSVRPPVVIFSRDKRVFVNVS